MGVRLLRPLCHKSERELALHNERYSGELPLPQVVPFFWRGFMLIDRYSKSDPQTIECFYLNNGSDHPSG